MLETKKRALITAYAVTVSVEVDTPTIIVQGSIPQICKYLETLRMYLGEQTDEIQQILIEAEAFEGNIKKLYTCEGYLNMDLFFPSKENYHEFMVCTGLI